MTSTPSKATAGPTPVAGQFAVVKSEYQWELISVESVTAKQFRGVEAKYGYKRTISAEKCRYCGDEASARKLYERLISSQAQYNDERQKTADRRKTRDAELIAAAISRATGEA